MLQKLFGKVAQGLQDKVTSKHLWCGRYVKVVDGSTVSMPELGENQAAYPEYVSQAMRFGARGYLLKDTPLEPLASAIRSVDQGYTQLGPGLFEKALSPLLHSTTPKPLNSPPEFAELTPREKEVLRLIAAGGSNREIAESLYIAERTVKNHVTSILSRLNLRDPPSEEMSAKGTRFANAIALKLQFLPIPLCRCWIIL